MHARAEILLEARQAYFGCFAAASDRRPALQHQHLVAGFRHIGRADQAVVPRAGHHISKRSAEALDWAMPDGAKASGASTAASFMNPRRVVSLSPPPYGHKYI